MSKIGRRAITLTSATAEVKNGIVTLKGPKGTLTHTVPSFLSVNLKDKKLTVTLSNNDSSEHNVDWGLHRALLANNVKGVEEGFSTGIKIVGLGYKAQIAGSVMTFTLGYSHKKTLNLPKGVEALVDKTGQLLTIKSIDKFLLGNTCDVIRSLRPPEPYKGTGIIVGNEVVRRKSGKAKVSAA